MPQWVNNPCHDFSLPIQMLAKIVKIKFVILRTQQLMKFKKPCRPINHRILMNYIFLPMYLIALWLNLCVCVVLT